MRYINLRFTYLLYLLNRDWSFKRGCEPPVLGNQFVGWEWCRSKERWWVPI